MKDRKCSFHAPGDFYSKKLFFTFLCTLISSIINAQALSSDTLHWAEHRVLSWEDFKGDDIEIPGMGGQCLMVVLAGVQKVTLFLPASTHVTTVFDRKNSWTIKTSRTQTTLKYYQLMFDLYEVYSRRLRKEFSKTKFGLDPNKVFQEKYNASLTELSDRNKQYMKETKAGTDTLALNQWNNTIQQELRDLEKFKKVK